jgi:hypothetical protein
MKIEYSLIGYSILRRPVFGILESELCIWIPADVTVSCETRQIFTRCT